MIGEPVLAPSYEPPPQPVWLISFADLISLLLCFFVMLFAMSTVELSRWQKVSGAAGTTNVVNAPATGAKAADDSGPRRPSQSAIGALADNGTELDYLAAILQRRLDAEPELQAAVLTHADDALVISLPGIAMFEAARADLAPEVAATIGALGRALGNLRNQVDVRGYGEAAEAARASGVSATANWELSIKRASAVAEEMRRGGYAREPNALGLGASGALRHADVVVRAWRPETQVRVR
jgi:chemotaxis protein MotB